MTDAAIGMSKTLYFYLYFYLLVLTVRLHPVILETFCAYLIQELCLISPFEFNATNVLGKHGHTGNSPIFFSMEKNGSD